MWRKYTCVDCLLFLASLFRNQLLYVYLTLFSVLEIMSLILMIMHKSGCAGATLLKDGDLKLKEVREKIMGENYKNKYQFLISRHCCIRKLRSYDEFLGHHLIRKWKGEECDEFICKLYCKHKKCRHQVTSTRIRRKWHNFQKTKLKLSQCKCPSTISTPAWKTEGKIFEITRTLAN